MSISGEKPVVICLGKSKVKEWGHVPAARAYAAVLARRHPEYAFAVFVPVAVIRGRVVEVALKERPTMYGELYQVGKQQMILEAELLDSVTTEVPAEREEPLGHASDG